MRKEHYVGKSVGPSVHSLTCVSLRIMCVGLNESICACLALFLLAFMFFMSI